MNKALELSGFRAGKHWGDLIEDRGSQITFSALGQEAPLDEKKKWDPDFKKREKIKAILEPLIPAFSIQLGGSTSIDVTRPGIDKAYGVKKLHETLGIALRDMIFVGDALFPGGNDYPAKQAGVVSIEVRDPARNQAGHRNHYCVPGQRRQIGAGLQAKADRHDHGAAGGRPE